MLGFKNSHQVRVVVNFSKFPKKCNVKEGGPKLEAQFMWMEHLTLLKLSVILALSVLSGLQVASKPMGSACSEALQSPGTQPCLCPPVPASVSHRRRPLAYLADFHGLGTRRFLDS